MTTIQTHYGLGDMIVMAPYIAMMSEMSEITIPCYDRNLDSVKSFFINHPDVKIVSNETEIDWDIKLGWYNEAIQPEKGESFIDWFYRQLELKRSEVLKFCPLLEASKRIGQYITPYEDFVFVHDDASRFFEITRLETSLPIIRPFKEGSILRYANLLLKAKEIHVIDSAFLHLCEALPTTGKLVYHRYARNGGQLSNYTFLKDWEIID